MEYKLAITEFFDAIENDDQSAAKRLGGDVKLELKILSQISDLNPSAKDVIDKVAELEKNVSSGKISVARGKYRAVEDGFKGQLERQLQDYKRKGAAGCQYPVEPKPDYDQPSTNRGDDYRQYDAYQNGSNNRGGYGGPRDLGQSDVTLSHGHMTYPDHKRSVAAADEETEKMKKSQRASQAMRHNNPDIADLSDTNRPTKIAERFSEFYDNEWTEAFDILSTKKKTEEKKITQLLLQIVQEAYAFCKQEAEREITAMHSAIINILEFGDIKGSSKKEKPLDASLLVQYRKENASRAIKRLQKDFFETKLKDNLGIMPPRGDGSIAKYGGKAVELTWWMCVQDPPIHMVSTKDRFNPDFYRAYTKSGIKPDFFVWPALRLHETGSIMTKGVVQYQ